VKTNPPEPWRRLNVASEVEARAWLTRCCGSTRWVEDMLARRPFASREALQRAARETWWALDPDDWREAFGHHPAIGDRHALGARFAATRDLSEKEQSGVTGASEDVLDALAAGNRAYEQTFGYIFIVCATGLSAEQMLRLLHDRLRNDPVKEIRIAAEEQASITAIRLDA
jgi:2-oxo-4-hydroxy-4-carboxy-5-ureidoimidazoline decarboxylase